MLLCCYVLVSLVVWTGVVVTLLAGFAVLYVIRFKCWLINECYIVE